MAGTTKQAMTPLGRTIVIDGASGRTYVEAINHETTKISVVHQGEDFIVLKIPGRYCWAGVGSREYAHPEMQTFRIIGRTQNLNVIRLEVEGLFAYELHRPLWRKKDNGQNSHPRKHAQDQI